MKYGPQFSDLLRTLRTAVHVSQDVGVSIGLGKGVWQSYEQCTRIPEVPTLFEMQDRLASKYANAIPSEGQFLCAWLAAQGMAPEGEILRTLRTLGRPRVSLKEFGWLKAFVFTGERREEQARTRLDCLIAPAAISDLRWIHKLDLDPATEFIPDKELTTRSWKDLGRRYGKQDILSISSGTVNAMTGLLTGDMVFRFDAVPEARHAYRTFIRDMGYLEEDESTLDAFQRCLSAAERLSSSLDPDALLTEAGLAREFEPVASDAANLLGGSTPSQFTSLFRQAVIDPVTRTRYQPERTADYAVISFARHPFGAADNLALVIAGTNGPATASAIHLLATKGLEGRPLGAVVRVRPAGADGIPKVEVVTRPYEPSELVASIEGLVDSRPEGGRWTMLGRIFEHWSVDELCEWKNLVDDLSHLLSRR